MDATNGRASSSAFKAIIHPVLASVPFLRQAYRMYRKCIRVQYYFGVNHDLDDDVDGLCYAE